MSSVHHFDYRFLIPAFSDHDTSETKIEIPLEDVIFAKITPCMENGKIAVARRLTNGIACGSTEFQQAAHPHFRSQNRTLFTSPWMVQMWTDQLYQEGRIGADDKEYLEVLTDAGSAAAHRGWEPDVEQLRVLTSIMEHFVSRFILKDEAGRLKGAIPPRQKRPNLEVIQKSVIDFPASKTLKDGPAVPDLEK